jgi:hypothetical protein
MKAGPPQATISRAPDPSGVVETSLLNCPRAPTLIADPPQRHVAEQSLPAVIGVQSESTLHD